MLRAGGWGNITPFMKLAGRTADILALLLLAGLPAVAARVGAPGPRSATLKLGPNNSGYLTGFAPTYEIEGLFASRWTGYEAEVALPLEIRGGPVEISYRFARILPQTAQVDVTLAGQPLDRFECRGGRYEVRRRELIALPPTPATIGFAVDSHDRRNLGLRFDWVRVAVGDRGRLALRGRSAWLPGLLAAGLFVLYRWAGHSVTRALLLAAPVSVASAAWAWLDPLAFAHVASRVAMPAAVLSALAALFARRMPGGRWMLPIFVAGCLLKGAGLFHPTTFYPDVQNARRYIVALATGEGNLAERNRTAQVEQNVGYPRYVAGRAYAFPYSPLFFVPFGVITDPDRIEDAFRHAGLVVASLEVLAVFILAHLVAPGRPVAAVAAALVAAFLPVVYSRLLLAMTVTLAGNLLDTALVAATLALSRHPESRRRLALVALFAAASVLTYVSSLFTVSVFLAMVSLFDRRLAPRLLAVLAASVALTVGWLYAPFARVFLTEIATRDVFRRRNTRGGRVSGRPGPRAGADPALLRSRVSDPGGGGARARPSQRGPGCVPRGRRPRRRLRGAMRPARVRRRTLPRPEGADVRGAAGRRPHRHRPRRAGEPRPGRAPGRRPRRHRARRVRARTIPGLPAGVRVAVCRGHRDGALTR